MEKILKAGRYVWRKTENDGGEDFVGGEGGIRTTREEERRMRGRGRRRGWMTKEHLLVSPHVRLQLQVIRRTGSQW